MSASVLHLVWAGGTGGAERQMLLWLERHPEQNGYRFYGSEDRLLSGGNGLARGMIDLLRWGWRTSEPSLHCWMYRAAVAGAVLRVATLFRVDAVFEIRHGLGGEIKLGRRLIVVLVGILARLLRIRCTFNSHAAMANHMRFGYPRKLSDVRWNLGRGLNRDSAAGDALRADLRIPADAYLVCSIGRYAPEKNFDAAVAAFKAAAVGSTSVYLLVGTGCSRFDAPPAVRGIEHLECIADVYSMADLIFIPSIVESLSNVLCEAIDCRCDIASTTAGDAVAYARHKGYENIEFGCASRTALRQLLERAMARFPRSIGARSEQTDIHEASPR